MRSRQTAATCKDRWQGPAPSGAFASVCTLSQARIASCSFDGGGGGRTGGGGGRGGVVASSPSSSRAMLSCASVASRRRRRASARRCAAAFGVVAVLLCQARGSGRSFGALDRALGTVLGPLGGSVSLRGSRKMASWPRRNYAATLAASKTLVRRTRMCLPPGAPPTSPSTVTKTTNASDASLGYRRMPAHASALFA